MKTLIYLAGAFFLFAGPYSWGEEIEWTVGKLSDQIGKSVTLRGKAITDGAGPSLQRPTPATGRGPSEQIIFIVDPVPPQTFKDVAGNAPTVFAWPDEIEGKEIEVTGVLAFRPSPKGHYRPGDGHFVKDKKRGPGEYTLKSASWKSVIVKENQK
ncbi:MAG: hypothetical protein ACXWQE_05215 [Bdellovibrionales bacterium]